MLNLISLLYSIRSFKTYIGLSFHNNNWKMGIMELKGLCKKFHNITAVDDLSFEVNQGEIFGFLGPNGAGKTTTISMLATLLEPSSGNAIINGLDISKQKSMVRKSIGIVFQDSSLDDELTAYENLKFHAVMYELDNQLSSIRINELLRLVDLESRKNDVVRTFSGGMKRRLEIARGIMHHPKIIFLDEPTIGLDPQTRAHIWEYVRKLNETEGITIILTTHYMEEADKLCDRIAIIDHGKIIALDTPSSLKGMIGGDVVSIKSAMPEKLSTAFGKIKWVSGIKIHDSTVDVHIKNVDERLAELLNRAERIKADIKSISIHKPTLEDVFLNLTGKSIREEEASPKDMMRISKKIWGR